MNIASRWKINKETLAFNCILDQMEFMDHSTPKQQNTRSFCTQKHFPGWITCESTKQVSIN